MKSAAKMIHVLVNDLILTCDKLRWFFLISFKVTI